MTPVTAENGICVLENQMREAAHTHPEIKTKQKSPTYMSIMGTR